MKYLKRVTAVMLAVLLVACARDMSLSATFSAPSGLTAGSAVYLGEAQVGEVSGLTTTDGGTVAEISVDPERAGALRAGSAALVTRRDGAAVVELYNYRSGAEPLANDDQLVGLNNALELAAWQAGAVLDTGRRSMNALSRSITGYFESEAWRRQKERMTRRMEALEEELGRTYEESNQAYRAFVEALESESEAARERAMGSYTELTRRLQEQIARFRGEGNNKIVEPLQRLLEDLHRALQRKPEQESA